MTYWQDVVQFLRNSFSYDPQLIHAKLQDVVCDCKMCVDLRNKWEMEVEHRLKQKGEMIKKQML